MSNLSINALSGASSSYSASSSQKLTEETKKKLEALGLDPSKYKTEAEGKAALVGAQTTQTAQAAQSMQVQGQQPPPPPASAQSIKAEVEDLAAKVGVSIGSTDKPNDILTKISDKIAELKAAAGTDQTKLAEVQGYQGQYDTINAEITQMQASKSKISGTLNALANYNKAALGLK